MQKDFRLESIEELISFIKLNKEHTNSTWIYRGQSDFTFKLAPNIERNQSDLSMTGLSERAVYSQFQRSIHHHLSPEEIPPKEDFIEWYSLIQHYGGPSRLLDFTYSIFVAAFFAVNDYKDKNDSVIWCIDKKKLIDRLNFISQELSPQLREIKNKFDQYEIDLKDSPNRLKKANPWFHDVFYFELYLSLRTIDVMNIEPCIIPAEPFRKNRRINIQKGLFLLKLDPQKSFLKNLSEMFDFDFLEKHNLTKELSANDFSTSTEISHDDLSSNLALRLIIPASSKKELIYHLAEMNLRKETLFPDFQGFAESQWDWVLRT